MENSQKIVGRKRNGGIKDPQSIVIGEVETKGEKMLVNKISPLVEEIDTGSEDEEKSSDSEFSITDSNEGEMSVSKLEGMGGNLGLEEWTQEAILKFLRPVVDRAKKE